MLFRSKNDALLHSREYFRRRPWSQDESGWIDYGEPPIDLDCFEKDDRPTDDGYNLDAFHWSTEGKHISYGNDEWTKVGKDDSEPIAWTSSMPREGFAMDNYGDSNDWQHEMVRRYGGFWP